MKAKQYEIWIADLNPTIGTAPGKIIPVLALQTDRLNKYHSFSIICPATSNIQKESEFLRIHL
jgi:mRNA interferase MazF